LADGSRKIVNISELTGMEGTTIVMQDIFRYERKGVDKEGRIVGEFAPTGVRPWFLERFKISGFDITHHMFERS
jgi:pilus assembly protein CpaF